MKTATPPVVLIHGLFLNHESWEPWVEHYARHGITATPLAWPGLTGDVESLRRDPTPLTHLTMKSVLDALDATIAAMPAPPIVIGHSFGGLFAQLLAYRGRGVAVVGIDATAPAGVLDLPFSTLKASSPVLANPLNLNKATMLSPEQFHYAFTNTLSPEDALPLYDRYAIPCANHLLFEGAFESFVPHSVAHIDPAGTRPPLLLITGSEDHLVTPGYTRANFELVNRSDAITAYHEFPGRPHLTGLVPGWEEVADFALSWALSPYDCAPDRTASAS